MSFHNSHKNNTDMNPKDLNHSTPTKLKLTTRGKYAVIAMVELARESDRKPVPLSDIANSGSISLSYLEQLFAALRRHGLVKSYRGPGGGYVLSKSPDLIRISDIIFAAEDSTPAKRISSDNSIYNKETEELWSQIGHFLFECLNKLSLRDALNGNLQNNPNILAIFEKLR